MYFEQKDWLDYWLIPTGLEQLSKKSQAILSMA
jgi:hypothetical protein